jgi:TRAP-type transport system periplasmic protein
MEARTLAMAALGAALLAGGAQAQQVTLKVHHFLPAGSPAQQRLIEPWCKRIAQQSKNRLQCQIYPSMQLGGNPGQLYDQVKDGVADVIWTIPSYSAGRFPLIEAFELPFMTHGAESASRALWKYVQAHAEDEFRDVHPLAFHTHGGGVLHMVGKPVTQRSDLRGLKIRAPSRQTTRMLAALGAVPVGMPASQIPEALSRGVIDGALLPYEVVASLKADELTRYHSETGPKSPSIYTSVFILAMNRDRYESLPADLKAVVDANSGLELSAHAGRVFADSDAAGRKRIAANKINVISDAETARWQEATRRVVDGWVKEVASKGYDGPMLLKSARDLIAAEAK